MTCSKDWMKLHEYLDESIPPTPVFIRRDEVSTFGIQNPGIGTTWIRVGSQRLVVKESFDEVSTKLGLG